MQSYKSNSTGNFIILKKVDKDKHLIQFLDTGTTKEAYLNNILTGKVKDQYAITVYGHGYYGDFKKISYWKQAKQLWQNMLKRCYCHKDTKGYYGIATVDNRWKCFAFFLEDLPKLENFDKWLKGQENSEKKYNLDKDFKIPGNKIYSFEACKFVTEYENKSAGAKNGKPYTKMKRT